MKYLCLLSGALLLLCGSCVQRAKNNTSERIITVTVEPQRYFAEAIAGGRFKINSMVPNGMSPETYDPTPQQLVALQNSEAYLRIGYIGFELSWMQRLIQNNKHLKVFDTSIGVDLIRSESDAHDHHGHHTYPGGVEPHIWNSAVNAQVIAKNTLAALCVLDPQGKAFYEQRYDSLKAAIQHTDETVRSMLENDNADRAFLIFHPALSYFARDYNLMQVAIEEDGREPSPAHLKELIQLCRSEQIRIIFVQPEFDRRHAEIIAEQTHTRIVPVHPLAYEWADEMINTARALTTHNTKQ